MPNNEVSLGIALAPYIDKSAVSRAERDLTAVIKKISNVEIEWTKIAKASNISVKEIKDITTAAADFSRKLSQATVSSVKKLQELGAALEDAQNEAAILEKTAKKAKGSQAEKAAEAWLAAVNKVSKASKDVEDFRKANQRARNEFEKVTKAHQAYADSLQKAAKFDRKQFASEMGKQGGSAFRGFISKDLKGVIGGIGGMGGAVGQATKGALSRRAIEAGAGTAAGGIGGTAGALLKIAPVFAGLSTSLGMLVALLLAASDHQSKLNKVIVSGTGTVNDFFSSGEKYAGTINNLRQAAMDAHGSMLVFGADSEKMLKVVNAFAVTSTGSLTKTSQFLTKIGGDLESGMKKFATSAISYGKALGMEAEEVATMMGNFQSEVGYSAEQSMNLMTGVVKAASIANMPVTKFMDIFKSVTPHVELFTNRIETLTGAISLLGRTMSPDQVKKFMEAFGKGLTEESFRTRLKKTLVAGVGVTSNILKKDFEDKANTFEDQMGKIGLGKEFRKAWESGNKQEMNKVLAQAEAAGLGPAQIGAIQRTYGYERTRRKGGPLETASAMKGAGMWSQVKIAEAMMRRLGQLQEGEGITGISEQVAENLGMTQQQINAIGDLIQSIGFYATKVNEYGTTGSKATDKALAEVAMMRGAFEEGKTLQEVTRDDMKKLAQRSDFRDMLGQAAENAMKDEKTAMTAEEIAREQYNATASITEKLTNVIAYLLEKLYGVLQPILDVLNDMWSWLVSDDLGKKTIGVIQNMNSQMQKTYTGETAAQIDIYAKALQATKGDPEAMAAKFRKETTLAGVSDQTLRFDFQNKLVEVLGEKKASGVIKAAEADVRREHHEKTGKLITPEEMSAQSGVIFEKLAHQAKLSGISGEQFAKIYMEMGETTARLGHVGEAANKQAKDRSQFEREENREKWREAKAEAEVSQEDQTDIKATGATKIYGEGEAPLTVVGSSTEKSSIPSLAHSMGLSGAELGEAILGSGPLPKFAAPVGKVSPAGPIIAGSAAAKGSAAAQKQASEDQAESTEAIIETEQQEAARLEEATNKVYDGVDDVLSLLKKGIKFESNFTRGQYKQTLKDATLESFRTALIEFAVIQAKMATQPEFQDWMADRGFELAGGSGTTDRMRSAMMFKPGADPYSPLDKDQSAHAAAAGFNVKQAGGSISETGLHLLHAGEYVMSAAQTANIRAAGMSPTGRGGNTYNIYVNAQTDASPEQIASVVRYEMIKAKESS